VDSALLGHSRVAEAVAFAAPDEKYGEIVAAAVVLTQPASGDADAITADIRKYAATKLAKFKVTRRAPRTMHAWRCTHACATTAARHRQAPAMLVAAPAQPRQPSWPLGAFNSLCPGDGVRLHSAQQQAPSLLQPRLRQGVLGGHARACEAERE